MSLNGSSIREENIKNSKMLLESTFEDDASFILGMYLWELGLNTVDDYIGKETIKIRLFNRTFSNANGATVKFVTPLDYKLVVGDIIFNSNTSEFLIVTEARNLNGIHYEGKLTLCNWILKWQNPKTGEILQYPCYDINSTQYNSGEQSNRQFTVGSSQHMITLPCDENTVIINTPQRFYLDKNKIKPTSFIVTQNDTTSYSYGEKGLVKVTLYESENNHDTDRVDLGICDYFEPDSIKTDNSDSSDSYELSKSVISYDSNIIKSGGDMKNFVGKFYDEIGNEITGIVPKWEIICDFTNYLEVSKSEDVISIGIDNDNYIDEEFKLVLSDENGNYSSTLLVRIESLL